MIKLFLGGKRGNQIVVRNLLTCYVPISRRPYQIQRELPSRRGFIGITLPYLSQI